MSERKFAKGLTKPGTAAQLRETVSQVVRETAVQNKSQLVEPLDFEDFILKNKTVLQNDPQRELLIYPQDDIIQVVLPKRFRSLSQNVPNTSDCNLFTRQCVASYANNWHMVHYKYDNYSGSYSGLPKVRPLSTELKEDTFEVDLDLDGGDDLKKSVEGITKEGFLMKGPEIGSDRMFVNIGSKTFKRRYCYLRQEIDGTHMLELYKDEKKGEAKITIVMDFCTDVVKNLKRGRFCFELRMTAGHKSYILAAENENDYKDWLTKLSSVIQQNKIQEEKRAASLERERTSPPPQVQPFGTLKGLEHSLNPQLTKYARETDTSIAHMRKESRQKLLPLCPQVYTTLKLQSSSQESSVEPYKEMFGQRVLIKCDSLRFRLQVSHDDENLSQIEPYYTTLCLYDARNLKKLTENFHFDLNGDTARAMVAYSQTPTDTTPDIDLSEKLADWIKYPKKAVFSVMNPHCDIFIVVKIEKVLQGGICQASEPYIKNAKDPKGNMKVFKSISTYCQRLGSYRQPFAWAAKPLFRLYSNDLDTSTDFPAIFRQENNKITDEELLKLLSEYRKPDKFSKLTVIPGTLKIQIEPMTDMPNNCLTSSLVPIKPFPIPPTVEPTIEVMEFEGSSEKEVYPYTNFVNHLYVYPQMLNFDTQKLFTRARNIACLVELRDSDGEGSKGIQCIYGRPGNALLVNQVSCAVLHHSTTPCWYEEIKVRLPINLTANHHLLFTFYHVSCDISKKKDTVESSVGFAWLPLLQKGKLSTEMQTIPVASHLPPGYLSVHPFGLGKGNAGPEINWIDSQKPIFTVSFNLISTVNTKDQHLFNLFIHAEKVLTPKPTTLSTEKEICKIIKALHAVQLTTLITYLPTLINQLFILLVGTSNVDIGLNVIRVLINLINMIYEAGRKDVLLSYVKYVFVTPEGRKGATVHEEMCKFLPSILDPNNTDFLVINKFMKHSEFFFQIVIKSMAQHLLNTGRIKMHRHERFPSEYLKNIEILSEVLIGYILSKHKDMPSETTELNKGFAHFLTKCLTLMDRGFVFKLINSYLQKFQPGDARSLQECKFIFFEILCGHEHFVILNLPISHSRISPKNRSPDFIQEFALSEEFCRHHYMVSMLLQEVRSSLNEISHIRKIALNVLRNLVAKHELDDRYDNKGKMSRIALLYVPWLSIVLDNINRLLPDDKIDDAATNGISNRMSSSSSYMLAKSSVSDTPSRHRFTLHFSDSPIHIRNSAFFDAIAGQSIVNGHSSMSLESDLSTMSGDNNSVTSQETTIIRDDTLKNGDLKTHRRGLSITQSTQIHRYDKLHQSESKDIFLVFLFVVKYMGDDQLLSWWQKSTDADVVGFFSVLELALGYFKYIGKRNIVLVKSQSVSSVKSKSTKAHTLPARMNPSEINHENTGTLVIHTRDNRENLINSEDECVRNQQACLEQHLTTEIGLVILDCMGLYCIHFRSNLLQSEGDNAIMRKIFDIYLTFIELGQGERLYKHVFAALRAFINNYSMILFKGNAVLCGKLCYELLRCCNSRLASVRQEACAILYLLMRSNFEFTGRKGLTRVHLQVIISVSQILGNVIGLNNARFQESISIVNSYATSDKAMKGTGFPVEVKDLTKRIRTVLMATVQMKEHHHDPEMLVDLQHSLANSYASTPELRHTWLENMTKNHLRDGNFSEAACCQLHIAALMAEYLKLKKTQNWGAEVFSKISSNIARDERGIKYDVGVQDVQYSDYTLLQKLETCAEYIDKAERYELLGELYKLIIPIYEEKRNYQLLKECYEHLAINYGKVVDANKSGKRLLGRFYRVGFYGNAYFEEESGVEYIYKEPKVTALSEISDRLYKQYCQKYRQEVVKMIQDSIPINQSDLDQKFVYIQVTHVTPYFDKNVLDERQTDFEQNHDVSSFMFETPFTKDGKARGSPEDQWKRRTMLTTEYSFPYVKKRIRVVSKRSIELSPIEVAIDEMRNRVSELEDVVFSQTTDVKKLQLVLQGSICVQVNAGPLTYASVFLDPALSNLYPDDKVEELKDIYREFLKICYSALQINSKIISQNQVEYQEALRENYKKLCSSLSELFGEPLWPHEETGSFKRNSTALFSAISGTSQNSSTA